jgi:hypothetical protein
MNVIISNPIISEFLSRYPEEKHLNCILGIILFGIYNIQSLSIDFSKILEQIDSTTSEKPSKPSSFLSRIKSQIKDEAGDTPRFTDSRPDNSKFHFSTSTQVLSTKPTLSRRPDHMKTPSIVNPEIITDYASVENSEVLRIADQFLNGQFVNEYCKMIPKSTENHRIPQERRGKERKIKAPFNENLCSSNSEIRKESRSNSSVSLNPRRNSFSVISANRSVRGDRSTSFSKFW